MSKRIPPAIAYTASVALEKGLSIITIPLMAAFLEPDAYGRFDVAMSLVEFVTLSLGLGLSHTLIRFASTAGSPEEETRCAAELLGTGLLLVFILGSLVQLVTPALVVLLKIDVELGPLRLLLLAATVSALVEMPLVWIRMKGQAQLFMYYTMGRALLQAGATWVMLVWGFGVSGVMAGNSIILLSYAAVLVWRQWGTTGAMLSWRSLGRIRVYGLPLVGAALAMFAIGNANRLFLPGHVSNGEIAHFGVASRLALAAALPFYPFQLWWDPQRIRILNEPGGLQRSKEMWQLGMSIIILGALAVALVGPLFIAIALPKSYLDAIYLLPLLVMVMVIHQTALLSNVGCYAGKNSLLVFTIDVLAAILACLGYLVLTPVYGIYGVIIAMAFAHSLRLVLYLALGQKNAPIPYPLYRPLVAVALGIACVSLAPDPSGFFLRSVWSLVSLGAVAVFLYKTHMIQIPGHIQAQIMSMVRYVYNPQ